jgi:hypothetical protein
METMVLKRYDVYEHWPLRNKVIALYKKNKSREDIALDCGLDSTDPVDAILSNYAKTRKLIPDEGMYNLWKVSMDIMFYQEHLDSVAWNTIVMKRQNLKNRLMSYL